MSKQKSGDIKGLVEANKYNGFSEEEFKDMLLRWSEGQNGIQSCNPLDRDAYEVLQVRPTSGRRLARFYEDESMNGNRAGKYFYIEGGKKPYNNVRLYSRAESFSDGYALVRRENARVDGFQFMNENGDYSRYFSEEEIAEVDPANLMYYRSDFELYQNNLLDVYDLDWRSFVDSKDGGRLAEIIQHEDEMRIMELERCRIQAQRDGIDEKYSRRAEWIKTVAYMVNEPKNYARDLGDEVLREDLKRRLEETPTHF